MGPVVNCNLSPRARSARSLSCQFVGLVLCVQYGVAHDGVACVWCSMRGVASRSGVACVVLRRCVRAWLVLRAEVRTCGAACTTCLSSLSICLRCPLCVPVAGRKFERSLLINLIPAELLHLQPFRRGRLASLPRHRRARRVLAMAWWARGGVGRFGDVVESAKNALTPGAPALEG